MPAVYDASEFVDPDAQLERLGRNPEGGRRDATPRVLTREELEAKVLETQRRLAELKQAQEALERERAALEELRRRQLEFQTGRKEMLHNLTRGIALLEEAEQETRRHAEQMASTLEAFRSALEKIRAIQEETWTPDNLSVELARALAIVQNARMEWNSALVKFPVLRSSDQAAAEEESQRAVPRSAPVWTGLSFGRLCQYGLALTWPVALAVLATALLVLWLR
ncbi:MAG: hypothetical protein RMN51_08255 [Verrucomicrobiota bacterium]|nr:hypothetical protein [Limisphaera sp.]MDW8382080.1 hypothetical protein [Verrucomicrobiota bacterium]